MLEKMVEEKVEMPEEVFFRYAYPCTEDLFIANLVSENDYNKMNDYSKKRKTPKREELERVYKNAVRRINNVAQRLNKDAWDCEVIRYYFLNEHNKAIDEGEGDYKDTPHKLREMCKVRVGEVIDKYKKGDIVFYNVNYGDLSEEAIGIYYSDANVGDKISTHWRFAVEKLR